MARAVLHGDSDRLSIRALARMAAQAPLPGLPASISALQQRAQREGWSARTGC